MFEKLETPKYKILQLGITALLLAVCFTIEWFFGKEHGNNTIPIWGFIIIYSFVYLIISIDVFKEMLESFKEKNIFNEQLLMIIATLGALFIGLIPQSQSMFFEAVIVMELFQLGELFEIISKNKSKKSLDSLIKIRPEKCNIFDPKTNRLISVEAKTIKIGTIITIQPGETIPLDGIIVEGNTNLNTVTITGESTPRAYHVGQEVLSGCININQMIKIKVTKEFENSTVSRIIQMVKTANDTKAKANRFIDKFCKWYTPIILGCSILVGLVGGLIQIDLWYKWLAIGLSCLIVSCPCALVISVPLSYFIAIGFGAKQGILIKGSNYLEQLAKIKTIVFDKTGTLTMSNFKVIAIKPTKGISNNQLLSKACSVEIYSTHPIAKAICLAYKKHKIVKAKHIKEIPGMGLIGSINNHTLLVGNEKLMNKYNINITQPNEMGSYVFVAQDNKYLGYIDVADQIKKDSYKAMALFKKANIKTIMLSGDLNNIVDDVANKLQIDQKYGQLLPQDKLDKLNEIIDNKAKNEAVAFVGDGINDAPSIAKADIGIAMGGLGSSSAINTSDVVLMDDKLSKIYTGINLSKKTNHIAKANIIFSLLIKIIVFSLTCCSTLIASIFPTWMSLMMPLTIFSDVGVTIIAILNSMRCGRLKVDKDVVSTKKLDYV